jgi:hypothetical protein
MIASSSAESHTAQGRYHPHGVLAGGISGQIRRDTPVEQSRSDAGAAAAAHQCSVAYKLVPTEACVGSSMCCFDFNHACDINMQQVQRRMSARQRFA